MRGANVGLGREWGNGLAWITKHLLQGPKIRKSAAFSAFSPVFICVHLCSSVVNDLVCFVVSTLLLERACIRLPAKSGKSGKSVVKNFVFARPRFGFVWLAGDRLPPLSIVRGPQACPRRQAPKAKIVGMSPHPYFRAFLNPPWYQGWSKVSRLTWNGRGQ